MLIFEQAPKNAIFSIDFHDLDPWHALDANSHKGMPHAMNQPRAEGNNDENENEETLDESDGSTSV